MRLLFLSLLLVAGCLSESCGPYLDSSDYTIVSGVLSTRVEVEGPIAVPVLDKAELYKQDHTALGFVTRLNGGTVRVFFGHHITAEKRLYWSVAPSTTSTEAETPQTAVRLCVESNGRHCYSPKDVLIDPREDLTIQTKVHRDGPYLRFSITLAEHSTSQLCQAPSPPPEGSELSGSGVFEFEFEPELPTPPSTLSQVLRLSDYPDAEEWLLELEQSEASMDLFQVAVLGLEDEQLGVSLWRETCMSYQDLADVYQEISGTSPASSTFRPQILTPLQESYHGTAPDPATCTLSIDSCKQYEFDCPTGTFWPHEEAGPLPAFCLPNIQGNFLVTAEALEMAGNSAAVGIMAKKDHTERTGSFVAIYADETHVQPRWELKDGTRDGVKENSAGEPVYIGLQRLGRSFSLKYLSSAVFNNDGTSFADWSPGSGETNANEFSIADIGEDSETYDICVLFSTRRAATDTDGTITNIKVELLPSAE